MRIREITNEGFWSGLKNIGTGISHMAKKSGMLGRGAQLDALGQEAGAEKMKMQSAGLAQAKQQFSVDLERDLQAAIEQGIVTTGGVAEKKLHGVEKLDEAKTVAEFVKQWMYDQFKGYNNIDPDYKAAIDKNAQKIQSAYSKGASSKFPADAASGLFDVAMLIRKSSGPTQNVAGKGAGNVRSPYSPTQRIKGSFRPSGVATGTGATAATSGTQATSVPAGISSNASGNKTFGKSVPMPATAKPVPGASATPGAKSTSRTSVSFGKSVPMPATAKPVPGSSGTPSIATPAAKPGKARDASGRFISKQAGSPTVAAPKARTGSGKPGTQSSAMSNMVSQLANLPTKSSTGGTTTGMSGIGKGIVRHQASATNPNQPAAAKPATKKSTKKAAPKTGTPNRGPFDGLGSKTLH